LFVSQPSLTLAHSQRKLIEFLGGDETASDRASSWLSEDNRRALLSQVGVGTIDQALMSALHARHNCLRLLGLLGKVLVVDEVHACDTYMRRVLCVLLEMHARTGGSAILLSATLPQAQRQELIDAWRNGRGAPLTTLESNDYPLVTAVWDTGLDENALTTRDGLKRRVMANLAITKDEAIASVLSAADAGQCVAWIRNTVRDAVESYDALLPLLRDRVDLFHARFTLGDRLAIEKRVLASFGKHSTHDQRAGRVLIATQVVEQSIDLDFDFMVTDVAPVDLMLQRAGRLHRHDRGDRGPPTLLVHGPRPDGTVDRTWLRGPMPGVSYVYEDHGRVWLSLQLLLRDGGFETPAAARTLVENVYGPTSAELMPPALREIHRAAEAESRVAGATGRANAIRIGGSYEVDGPDWWRDELTPTRLGEPSITLALGIWDGTQVSPLHAGRMAWALSSISLRASSIGRPVNAPGAERAVDRASLGRWRQLLALQTQGEDLVGFVNRIGRAENTVRYDRKRGLVW